jgi:hypothetical protein
VRSPEASALPAFRRPYENRSKRRLLEKARQFVREHSETNTDECWHMRQEKQTREDEKNFVFQ